MNVNEMNWELVHFLLSQKEKSTALSVWGCRGWQAARTWVSVSPEMVGFPAPIGPPGASQSTGAQKGTKGT